MVDIRCVNQVIYVLCTSYNHALASTEGPRGARRPLQFSVFTYFVPTHKIEHRARGRQVVGLKGDEEVSGVMSETHNGGVSVLAWNSTSSALARTRSVFGSVGRARRRDGRCG